MQQCHKGARPKTEATRQEADKGNRRQTAAMSEKIKDWTLWSGRPPPKQKKKNAHRAEASNVETPAPNT
jgi:hypothetical protein